MSRIGKLPIKVPAGVEVTINGQEISVKGPKGELKRKLHPHTAAKLNEGVIVISVIDQINDKALWGLSRALVANMVNGVNEGFVIKLEINGVGYRAAVQGQKLELNVGYSHPVSFVIPQGVEAKVEKNVIILSAADNESLGQFAANIRKVRPPEPYKGKGIKYAEEHIRRKAGKKAVASE